MPEKTAGKRARSGAGGGDAHCALREHLAVRGLRFSLFHRDVGFSHFLFDPVFAYRSKANVKNSAVDIVTSFS